MAGGETGVATSGTTEAKRLYEICKGKAKLYSDREIEFLRSISGLVFMNALSPAQLDWLRKLAEKEEIDFDKINRAAMTVLPSLVQRWLPTGITRKHEYVACNPLRADSTPGSFSVNLNTGKWADFALQDAKGGDPISLAAYLFHSGDQIAAARDIKRMLGA